MTLSLHYVHWYLINWLVVSHPLFNMDLRWSQCISEIYKSVRVKYFCKLWVMEKIWSKM